MFNETSSNNSRPPKDLESPETLSMGEKVKLQKLTKNEPRRGGGAG
jgi:hypothetical protein